MKKTLNYEDVTRNNYHGGKRNWQMICNLFGFDPATTMEIVATATLKLGAELEPECGTEAVAKAIVEHQLEAMLPDPGMELPADPVADELEAMGDELTEGSADEYIEDTDSVTVDEVVVKDCGPIDPPTRPVVEEEADEEEITPEEAEQ